VEILAQSSTAFVLTHNFQGTHIAYWAHRAVILAIAWHLVMTADQSSLECLIIQYYIHEMAAPFGKITAGTRLF